MNTKIITKFDYIKNNFSKIERMKNYIYDDLKIFGYGNFRERNLLGDRVVITANSKFNYDKYITIGIDKNKGYVKKIMSKTENEKVIEKQYRTPDGTLKRMVKKITSVLSSVKKEKSLEDWSFFKKKTFSKMNVEKGQVKLVSYDKCDFKNSKYYKFENKNGENLYNKKIVGKDYSFSSVE